MNVLVMAGMLGLVAVAGSSLAIRRGAKRRTYSDVATIPHRRVGLVLGCGPRRWDGRPNLFFRHRMEAAAALFKAGRVDYLLVSGDNHTRGYDEPTDMKDSLVQAGVPGSRIYCDFAGFRTLDSLVRVREVFGQTAVTVVSQKFHNERAIYIARHVGVDAIGFNARDVGAGLGFRTLCREQLARVRTVLDVNVFRTRPRFLGPAIPIGDAVPSSPRRSV